MNIEIKDFYNRVVGRIEEHPNGDKTVRDFYGKILGYYKKQENVTKDFYNRIIARGDASNSLIDVLFWDKKH